MSGPEERGPGAPAGIAPANGAVRLDLPGAGPEGGPLVLAGASGAALVADAARELHPEVLTESGGLRGCLACGHAELYSRKDFPRAIGITIVVVAALLVPFVPYYLSLFGAAILDAVLYRISPDLVACYVCGAEHRRFPEPPHHPRFDRTIEERLKYGERAVMGSPMREGGTADAPEPEH